MNIVVLLLIVVMTLLLVRPVQAGHRMLADNLIPAVLQTSFKMPLVNMVSAKQQVSIVAIDGSEIQGTAELNPIRENLDTKIKVRFSGLESEAQYVPIYYSNSNCDKEDDSIDKSVNGAFFADQNGNGEAEDTVKDSINRIGSISLRRADNFELVACGQV